MITTSGKEYTPEWWREVCTSLGINDLRREIHSHGALPGERAGRSRITLLHQELAKEKDFDWLDILLALLHRYHNMPWYHGLSPNEIVFGPKKCYRNMPLNYPCPCKEASLSMEEIQEAEKIVSKLTDWLWVQNQGREPHTILKWTSKFSFENMKSLWAEIITFFPCGRSHLQCHLV